MDYQQESTADRAATRPVILAVGDDGTVEVQLADGTLRTLRIPTEQVELVRRVVFGQKRSRRSESLDAD